LAPFRLVERIRGRIARGENYAEEVAELAEALESNEELKRRCQCLLAHQMLLDERLLAVETNRLFSVWGGVLSRCARVWWRTGHRLRGSVLHPLFARAFPAQAYRGWIAGQQAALPSCEAHQATAAGWSYRPTVALLMPAGSTERLAETVESVRGQSYPEWQLCVTLNGIADPGEMLRGDERIRVTQAAREGAAEAANRAAALASAEYLAVIEPGDRLAPHALHSLVERLQRAPADIVYSDEDRLEGEARVRPLFKPDWSPALLESCMYAGRLLAIRSEVFQAAGGFRAVPAYEHDFLLRAIGVRVEHVPRVLYHRRGERLSVQPARAPLPEDAALTVVICSKTSRLLEQAVESVQRTRGAVPCGFLVVHHEEGGEDRPMRRLLERLGCRVLRYGGPFHFALMNNLAVERVQTPYVLFLNDDVTAFAPGWCERIVTALAREDIGVAGSVLRYRWGALQHAGIVLGVGDGAAHVGRSSFESEIWPWLTLSRDVSAVTGACLGMRTAVFRKLGGFHLEFPNNYNDVDLCLRARAAGYRVVCLGGDELQHIECSTRAGLTRLIERDRFYERWGREADPFYSPCLADSERIGLRGG